MAGRKVCPQVPYSWPTRVLLVTALSAFVIVWSVLAMASGYSYLWSRGARARLERFAKRVGIPRETVPTQSRPGSESKAAPAAEQRLS